MLNIQNLTVSVENKKIIKKLNLNIELGKICVVMGPNGSGKSSLVAAISGDPVYKIESGKIIFQNNEITDLAPEKRARLGIYCAQQNPVEIPGLTVSALLRAAVKHFDLNLNALTFSQALFLALESVGLNRSYATRFVNDGLSGGEKKRLELAQALVLQPKLLILDEPDSGLDVDALRQVACAINQYRSPKRSIIIITHYQRLLDLVDIDAVYVIKSGKIVKRGGVELTNQIHQSGFADIKSGSD